MKEQSENKKKILECSIRLFALKGFNGASIREIAKDVGTTVPNIYYYYGNKERLYNHILETTNKEFSQTIQNASAAAASLGDRLVAMTIAKYRFIDKHPERMRIFFREWFAPENGTETEKEVRPNFMQVLATMAYIVNDSIARGETKNVDPEHAAWVLVGVFNAFDLGFIAMGIIPSDEEIKAVSTLALEGLLSDGSKFI